MTLQNRTYLVVAGIVLVCGLLVALGLLIPFALRLFNAAATPDFRATLQARITQQASSTFPAAATPTGAATPPSPVPGAGPAGRIFYTCQIFKYQSAEQICVINPDGTGFRRLTQDNGVRHYYPSPAPDGKSVVFSQYREDNVYEVYELTLADGTSRRLSDRLGVLTGPEISPDGKAIVFMRWTPASDQYQIWLMDRDGRDPRRLFAGTGWDPTWSPDGTRVLFASDREGSAQLYIGKVDGSGVHRISDLPSIRGRSDWSPANLITTYSGEAWKREVFVMDADGSNAHRVSPPGGNSQGPTFSPDGEWIAFTAYFDHAGDIHGCEIYIMRVDGTDLRRVTDNDYCDYQPRWGN